MDPQNENHRKQITPLDQQRQATGAQHYATANLARQQINNIYSSNQNQVQPQQGNFDWQAYHKAWQQYYQRYYHQYYWQQLVSERQKMAAEAADKAVGEQMLIGREAQAVLKNKTEVFKQKIRQTASQQAEKFHKSHLFAPIMSALAVVIVVLFLQFNSVVVAQIKSYISPGAISSNSITVDPNVAVEVSQDPKLIIPKINVEVPVNYNVDSSDENAIQVALRDGAVHYGLSGADALPGQNGNTVILGHSSNDIFNQGEYKFVFVLLDQLEVGDVFYLNYNGTRYVYKVTETKIIEPTDIASLQIGTSKPMATLITCTPAGTALRRLLVFGEQISPDPVSATSTSTITSAEQTQTTESLVGNEPSLLDQIWQFFF